MSFNIPTQTLGQVFQNQYPFYVPKYQRGYAWESDEVTDFLKDIAALQKQSTKDPHFMGGLVHVFVPASNTVSRTHEVVDGQQRMATFTLVISTIVDGINRLSTASSKNAFKQTCAAHKEEIEEKFLRFKETINGKRVLQPKLIMSRVDADFFTQLVDGATPSATRESHRRIQTAHEKFRTELIDPVFSKSISDSKKLEELINLCKLIADNFIVIHIVSQSRKEAYRLFSVLNDRGRNLSDGDLLRARTLEISESDSAAQTRVEGLWDRILDGTEDVIDKFLRAYYPSTIGRRAPNNGLFDAYEEAYLTTQDVKSTEKFVAHLEEEKPKFISIMRGEWPFPIDQNSIAKEWDFDRLYRLVNVLRHEAAHPLLLSAVKLGEKKFIAILRLLERFVFRYITIVGAHPSPLYSPYYSEAVSMRSAPSSYSVNSLKAKLESLVNSRAQDSLFQDNLRAKIQYSDDSGRNRVIKHFLTTLESYRNSYDQGKRGSKLKPDLMMVFDLSSTTIEHIYPQNAQPANKNKTLEPLKNQLGNLTILGASDNSTIGNADFQKKKLEFAKSSVGFNRKLATLGDWKKAELKAREVELLQMATEVFGIS